MGLTVRNISVEGYLQGKFPPAPSPPPPPPPPFTADTSILLNGTGANNTANNTFVDSSANNFAITRFGNTTQGSFSPFSNGSGTYNPSTMGGSMFFDGSGDYLTIPDDSSLEVGAEDFTIEAWIYIRSYVANSAIISKGTSSPYLIFIGVSNEISFYSSGNGSTWSLVSDLRFATNPSTNTWHHIAVTRSGTTFRTFFNGALASTKNNTSGSTVNNSSPVSIGNYTSSFNGYISNLRIVKGTAVYTSAFTPPTAPVTAISGTSLLLNGTNAAIFDATGRNNLETVGDAKISTTISATGSMYFDGSADRLVMPASSRFAFGTGDFTIECWVYSEDVSPSQKGILQTSTTAGGLSTSYNTGLILLFGMNKATQNASGGFVGNLMGTWFGSSTGGVVAANTWTHIAVVRSSGAVTTYINGVAIDTTTITANVTGNNLVVGGYYSETYLYSGYMNDLRITKGEARYTANFTPPTRS